MVGDGYKAGFVKSFTNTIRKSFALIGSTVYVRIKSRRGMFTVLISMGLIGCKIIKRKSRNQSNALKFLGRRFVIQYKA
jgi:hypothetical protein